MGIFDNAKNKATEFLNTDKGEQQSDALLDRAADAAKARLGEGKSDHIDRVRETLDERVGNNNDGNQPNPEQNEPGQEPHAEPGREPGNA